MFDVLCCWLGWLHLIYMQLHFVFWRNIYGVIFNSYAIKNMSKKVTPKIEFDANYIKSLPAGELVKFDD